MNKINDNTGVSFLHEKIQGIRSALFFIPSNDILMLPTSIITVLRVDRDGYLWFFTKRPSACLSAVERGFPVRLDFFRNKKDYFLHITGKAFMVNVRDIAMEQWADIPEGVKANALNELMLLKVKMMTVEYFEDASAATKGWWTFFTQKIRQWVFSNKLGYKPYGVAPKNYAIRDFKFNRA